ncbi:Mov34/MPN/PAD-1 family protein [Kroppenstedtia eburnea]|uniref:Proteasome lid subunit RPN8/RPN11, contains Jab1/MPN metalloenzyme (JAMM) motif n=1 Tax=Kroppenstedtia eburnea TaxID=714067 RepID=A0A1N7NWG0_9BACL|nr:M67 family metallopeptidase [Kroppenstedtia eburnea]EGK08444.1 Mov34/MPN/PAD-1 family protein [Desmospora sp. 8437]QKI81201.1 M67 family metallopeptidase [Kroppenstedtia eburnea]SIT02667.1 Proteasome lid subunit RPN8/RPN11, contains Jab1/MPN metalloenzyme (JAMM) motif [Kroppenstedtia eburnea]
MALPTISIQRDVILQIENHCLRELPREGCGLLAGHGRDITRFFPIPNQDPRPHSFSFEPRAYLETLKEMQRLGLELLGIVHSHPSSDPRPSAKDIQEWHYPGLTSWILSLKHDEPRLSAYCIQNGQVFPVMYLVSGPASDPS